MVKVSTLQFCVFWLCSSWLLTATAKEVIQLDKVVVSESEQKAATTEATSTSTLETQPSEIQLNIEELKGVAGGQGDPINAINTLPGVVSASGGQGRAGGFYVRGSNANENLIWIDGLPVAYIFHLGGLYSILNPDIIESFDTYLGGFGVEYGDRLGGVVSVNTRAPYSDQLRQSYQLGFYDSSARIEGPISENSSGFFAIRRSYIDLLLPTTGKLGSSENEYTQFPEFWDMQARYRYELENGFFDVSLFTAEDKLRFDIKDAEQLTKDPAIAGELGSEKSFQTLGARWHTNVTRDLAQKIRFGAYRSENQFVIGTQQANDPNPGENYGIQSNSLNYFMLPQWDWQVSGTQSWKMGLDAYQLNYDVNGYTPQPCREGQPDCTLTTQTKAQVNVTESGHSLAPYVELDQAITDRLYARLGLRNSEISIGASQLSGISPRLTLEYDLTDRVILNATWGRYLQAPQGAEIIEGIGNPSLVMTEAEHRIIGAKVELSSAWSAQIEAFHKPMKKLVVSRSAPENYANEGSGYSQGFDMLFKRQWRNGAYGWIGYSYLETERVDDKITSKRLFDGDQPHTLNVVWNQPFTGSWSNWTWGATLKAQSGLPYTEVVGREGAAIPGSSQTDTACQTDGSQTNCYWKAQYGSINGDRLPFYLRLDLGMEREWRYSDWNLIARFEILNANALLRPNVVGYDYDANYANYQNPTKVYDLPFLPSFSVRANF